MNKPFKTTMTMGIVLSICVVGTSWGAASLPYGQSFEDGWTASGDPWTTAGTGSAVSSGEQPAKLGDRTCKIDNSSLTLTLDTLPAASNIWVQIYAKPVAGTDDPEALDDDVKGAFYVKNNGGNGELRAHSNGTWVTVATAVPLNHWLGFIVHLDRGEGYYDIYYQSAGTYGAEMVKINTSRIQLKQSGAGPITEMTVESGDPAYIDAVGVSLAGAANPVDADTPDKVLAHEFSSAVSYGAAWPIPVYGDSYADPQNALDGAVGADLQSGLIPADKLRIYASKDRWDTYQPDGDGGWITWGDCDPENPCTETSSRTVEPSTLMQLTRVGTALTYGFFAYHNLIVHDGVKVSGAPTFNYALKLYGKFGGHSGFTALKWPRTEASLNGDDFPIKGTDAGLVAGDRLYMASPSNPNRYEEFTWNGSAWRFFQYSGSVPVQNGANMWIKRNTDDDPDQYKSVPVSL